MMRKQANLRLIAGIVVVVDNKLRNSNRQETRVTNVDIDAVEHGSGDMLLVLVTVNDVQVRGYWALP